MFRLFIVILFSLNILNATDLGLVKLNLDKSFDSYGVVKTDIDLKIGSSGVISQEISDGISTIVARAIVSKKIDGGYEVTYNIFDDLDQDALPNVNLTPKAGDKIMLNYLYKRVLPIVPNADSIKTIGSKYTNLDILEPDLFAAYVSKNNIAVPNRGDFKSFCQKNGISLLYFGFESEGMLVDCYSFKTLDKDDLSYKSEQIQLPFYSRVEHFSSSTMASIIASIRSIRLPFTDDPKVNNEERKDEIGDFYSYYKSLIKE